MFVKTLEKYVGPSSRLHEIKDAKISLIFEPREDVENLQFCRAVRKWVGMIQFPIAKLMQIAGGGKERKDAMTYSLGHRKRNGKALVPSLLEAESQATAPQTARDRKFDTWIQPRVVRSNAMTPNLSAIEIVICVTERIGLRSLYLTVRFCRVIDLARRTLRRVSSVKKWLLAQYL